MKFKNALLLFLLLLVASFAGARVPCGSAPPPSATLFLNWPQFHYDNAHTGCNPYESILSPNTVGNLVLDWKFTTGFQVESAPTVVNGIVYVGSDDNYLYALNANTGALIWKYDTASPVAISPTVANGIVYVDSNYTTLVALNASTGVPIWSQLLSLSASPVVSGGVLYVASGSTVYALNASTGESIWESYAFDVGESSPALANGVIYVGAFDSNLYALSAGTGKVLWAYKTGDAIQNSAVVANGIVYVGAQDYFVYAVDALDGTLLWKTGYGPVSCRPYRSCGMAVADGVLYVEAAFPNYTTFALNARTGDPLWGQWNIGGSTGPAVANGVLYLGSDDNNVYALSVATGEVLWKYATGDYVASSPAVANGKVYVGSYDGNVYAFHLPGR